MKSNHQLFTIIIVLTFNVAFGQKLIEKRQLKHLFKESVDKYSLSNSWIACNENNTSTTDTIKFYNHTNFYYHSTNECCHFIRWTFKNPHSFWLSKIFMCIEPPTDEVGINNLHKLKIKKIKNELYMQTYSSRKLIDNYKVIELKNMELWEKGDKTFVLTLVRIK